MSRKNWMQELGWSQDHTEDLRFTGYSYIRQGKYDIALPLFEALVILEPNSAYDSQTVGAIYLQLNNPIKALKAFDQSLKIEADHGPTLLNVTKALFMLGRKEEALKLAGILKNEKDVMISNVARALLLAWS